LQRSVLQLRKHLSKRGITATAPAIAAVLTGSNLCVPSASAATLTMTVLKAAPALKASTLFAHTLNTMNIATTAKTAAVVLALSAIPVTVLWKQTAELEQQVLDLQNQKATASKLIAKVSPETGPRTAGETSFDNNQTDDRKPRPDFRGNRGRDDLERQLESARKTAARSFLRLSLSIPNLTEAQKVQMKQALEDYHVGATEIMYKAFNDPLVQKMWKDPSSLTKEERDYVAARDPRKQEHGSEEESLKPILSADQFAAFSKFKEARRVADAESAAGDALKSVGKYLDLSPEQKDKLFQALAQQELALDRGTGRGEREESQTQIIREHLTPQQFEVYNQIKEEDRRPGPGDPRPGPRNGSR